MRSARTTLRLPRWLGSPPAADTRKPGRMAYTLPQAEALDRRTLEALQAQEDRRASEDQSLCRRESASELRATLGACEPQSSRSGSRAILGSTPSVLLTCRLAAGLACHRIERIRLVAVSRSLTLT